MSPRTRAFAQININTLLTVLIGAYVALHGKDVSKSTDHIEVSQDTVLRNQENNIKTMAELKGKVDTLKDEFSKFKQDLYDHLSEDSKEVQAITTKNMEQDSRLDLFDIRLTSYIQNHRQ